MSCEERRQGGRIGRRDKAVTQGTGKWFHRRNEVPYRGQEFRMEIHQRFGDLPV